MICTMCLSYIHFIWLYWVKELYTFVKYANNGNLGRKKKVLLCDHYASFQCLQLFSYSYNLIFVCTCLRSLYLLLFHLLCHGKVTMVLFYKIVYIKWEYMGRGSERNHSCGIDNNSNVQRSRILCCWVYLFTHCMWYSM